MKFTFESKPFSKDVQWEGNTFKSYSTRINGTWHTIKCQDKNFDMSTITKGTEVNAEVRTNSKGYPELWILKDFENQQQPTKDLANEDKLKPILDVLDAKIVDKEYFDNGINKLMNAINSLASVEGMKPNFEAKIEPKQELKEIDEFDELPF